MSKAKNVFENVRLELNILEEKEWYKVSKKLFSSAKGGKLLLRQFDNSLGLLLQEMYPNYTWLPWYFKTLPRNFFLVWDNQKFLKWVEKELDIKVLSDWYRITQKQLNNLTYTTKSLFAQFGGLINTLKAHYPDYEWKPWLFNTTQEGYWENIENQRYYIGCFEKEYGIADQLNWYNMTNEQLIVDDGGRGILKKYDYSLYFMLLNIYPNLTWYPWLFKQSSKTYWKLPNSSIDYVRWLEKELNIVNKEEWYEVDFSILKEKRGFSRAVKNRGILKLLKEAYPEYNWVSGKFKKAFPNTWTDESNSIIDYIKLVEPQLKINQPQDWYRVSKRELKEVGLTGLYKQKNLIKSLCKLYPNFQFEPKLFSITNKQSTQRILYELVKEIFYPIPVIEKHLHDELTWNNTNQKMEIDVWVPDLNIGFEYQGEHHYSQLNKAYGPAYELLNMTRDQMKAKLCKEKDITLIAVPYWWKRFIHGKLILSRSKRELKKLILQSQPSFESYLTESGIERSRE